jgi:hypothetical protein
VLCVLVTLGDGGMFVFFFLRELKPGGDFFPNSSTLAEMIVHGSACTTVCMSSADTKTYLRREDAAACKIDLLRTVTYRYIQD